MLKKFIILFIIAYFSFNIYADEGMFLVNLLDNKLEQKMKKAGLQIDVKVIYDEENVSISDAIVSLDFGCTGSMISADGLIITNHHCAYDDIQRISTLENNYLENGFWAKNRNEEIKIKGKNVFFLKKVLDLTDEILFYQDSVENAGENRPGIRKLSSVFEKKYFDKNNELEASLSSMWNGKKYYLFFYKKYDDVRLVAAPPSSIGSFGNETDNWEYPQHKCDFTIYRVYDKNEQPLNVKHFLKISTSGYQDGDFSMILGYPGSTNRYVSSAELQQILYSSNVVTDEVYNKRMEVLKPMMEENPEIRLKYATEYFMISNVQELRQGEVKCSERFDVIAQKKSEEKELTDTALLNNLEKAFRSTDSIELYKNYMRNTLTASNMFRIGSRYKSIIRDIEKKNENKTLMPDSKYVKELLKQSEETYKNFDESVEKAKLSAMLAIFEKKVPQQYWNVKFLKLYITTGKNMGKITDMVFEKSIFRNKNVFEKSFAKKIPYNKYIKDPMLLIASNMDIVPYNTLKNNLLEGLNTGNLHRNYTHLLYDYRQSKNMLQAPNANSTMRLTYGNIGGLNPSDGVYCDYFTTSAGLLEKYNPKSFNFHFDDKMLQLLKNKDFGKWAKDGVLNVDFMTNNDITGGNSGSPVLNAKGEIIGLAFDGNRESLAGNYYYVPNYNKCICVDIRYILFILDKYAEMGYLLEELGL
ncbi:MAG: S46 family peptidase [Bacteroidales bacterium]|jgi:V8-like Glu-specific endopeptidase|nr:S46 family peptidase [Bacteroidales bacterium]